MIEDVTGEASANTVATVGGSTAALVHSAELLANAATDANTSSAIVRRDASGAINCGNINSLGVYKQAGDIILSALQSTNNTLVGPLCGINCTTALFATGVGNNAIQSLTTGTQVTGIGQGALRSCTTGGYNTSVGVNALSNVGTGTGNVGIGNTSGSTLTTGSSNTFLGCGSDVSANNLSNATAIGYGAIVAASNTIQLGSSTATNVNTSATITAPTATLTNLTATNSTMTNLTLSGCIKNAAGAVVFDTITPATCCFVGGAGNQTQTGSLNAGFGQLALSAITSGSSNVGFGTSSLRALTTGYSNSALSPYAFDTITTGYGNVGLEFKTGTGNSALKNCTLLGTYANCSADNLTNATAIGANAVVTASNTI